MGEEHGIEEVKRELEKLAEVLQDLRVHSIVLFGSRARGEHLKSSDYDVLIVAEGFENMSFYEREYLVLSRYRGRVPLEPWCYTPREVVESLERRPRIDIVDAVEHGMVVYDDGFWKRIREKYRGRWRMTSYGGVHLE